MGCLRLESEMVVCASVPGFRHPGVAMYLGKTLFAQAMDFLPWKTFHRIVNRYGGDHRTRSLSCAEQFRVMAFAQLTYRESLRDIEVCLAAQAGKLYHMGIGAAVARSTLADANESRDWRIYFELAQRLITKARALYVDEDFGVELANTVYALDSSTIDLCLSVFPWAPFRSTKAAVNDQVQRSTNRQAASVPHQQFRPRRAHHRKALQIPLAGGTVLQMDQAAPAHQSVLRHQRECRQIANLDRRLGLRPGRHREKAPRAAGDPLRNSTDFESHPVRENPGR